MVNTATSNEQHHHHHEHEQQNLLHHPEPLNDPSGILSNSPNFASVNGIQIFEPIYQPNIAEKNLKVASVTLPNGHKRDFHIHKNSKGNVLFDLAAESETLLEKDYFGLRYEDELGEMTWLYPDKRIQKQLKHKPWNFVFQIKFYPPEPSALADDLTRYLLYLQIRKEIYEGKLPASYAKQILLAAMVMQAEIGDFEAIKQSPNDYERFLREQHLIPQIDEEVLTKVREAHREQKGLTPNEAHQKYLDTAKDLAKYGFTFFNAKDTKNGPVIIGIYAHGICVYKDQLQIHRFLWQGVNKIQFRGNKFSVVLKPGELDPKKEVTVSYRLADYTTAKKLYRTAVEHHTFFRLIKPEDKPKGTFLRRWGSDRFRYQGRTYFQAKMASQMFDHPSQVVTIQRTPSGRQVSRSVDDLAQQPRSFPTSPMHYVDETTQQLTSPEKSKSYPLSASKADKAKKKAEELSPLSVVVQQQQQQSQQRQHKSKRNSMSSTSSSESESSPRSVSMASPNSGEYYVKSSYTPQQKSTISPYEEVIFPLSISKEERQQQYQTPVQHSTSNRNSRVRFSSDTKPVTPDDGSAVAMAPAVKPGKRNAKRRLFGPVNDDHTAFSPVDDLYKALEISSVPLDSRVTLYDKGWYTTTSSSSATRALSPTNFFVGCCKPPRRTLVSERLLRNRQSLPSSSEYSIIKRAEIKPHPIRYFVEVYHSGKPQIETKRKQRFMARKDVDFVNPNELNRDYYNFPKDVCYEWDRTECSRDPEPLPLKQFSTIYWFGGNSKQGNAKPVGIKGQNIIVSSDVQQGEGERIIITEASTSQQSAATKEEEPRVVEIIEEKPVITVRQEEGKTVTTIETTTVITTTENFESGTSEVVNEESLPIQSSTPLPIESVQDIAHISPIESEQVTVIETTPKSEELGAVPIKKYSNVYHSGTSLENRSPMEWVKKKRGILFIKKSSSPKSQTSSSTVEEPQPSTSKETTPESLLGKRKKSSSTEPIVTKIAHEVSERARTFSMSKHYPEVSKPFEGQLKEIHRNPEAPSANLFDCISFVEEESITDEPKTKKAKPSRAARFCLACVGGNRQRGTERKASKEIESSQDPRLTTEGGIHVEDVYTYEPTKVTEIHETVENVTKTEKKKYDKIPEVIVTHDLSLIPATSEEEIQQTLPLQIEFEQSDLSQHVETIPAGTSYQEVEEDTKTTQSVTIPPTPTPSEATYGEEYTRETSVQKSEPQKAMELSGYPPVIEEHRSEVDISNKNDEVPHENLRIEQTPISIQAEEHEKQRVSTVTQEHRTVTKEKLVSSVASVPHTFTEKTVKEERVPTKTISKRTKMLAEKKHYPLIGTSSEGHVSELQRKEDFKESNLFDTISFISDSEDSGLGADSGSKSKSGGLICIPKSKKSKKTKTSEIKKINYTEVQANRNKKVKRARLFSFSKDYPEIGGEIYEGELKELKPIQEAKFTNLFDEINFAPDEQSLEIVKQENVTKSKSTGLWCVPTAKKQKRTSSIASIKLEEIVDSKTIEKTETYSLSKYYPEVGQIYEGELSEIALAKDSVQINIFDAINFRPKDDKIEIVEIEKQPIVKEKSKSSGLWCGQTSKKKKRTNSVTSEESIKKGTLNALQIARNKAVARARTFSFSKDYPEIGGEIYGGELKELAPVKQPQFTNLFDEIDFAPDEQSVKIKVVEQQKQLKPKKDSNLICMKKSKRKTSESSSVSSLSLQDHKNLNAMQIARNKIVRRTRYFSTSKHYPEIGGEIYEGDLNEFKPIQEAKFTNLFDEINFASDEVENINVEESKNLKAKKHKKSNLLCTTKSKRKTSEVSSISSGTSVSSISLKDHKNLNAMQIARNKFVRRAQYFSTSKHYPEIGVPTEGSKLIELKPVEQAPFAKLFDEISFASSEDLKVKEVILQKVTKKDRGLPNCLACTGFKSKPKEITEETDEFAYERHTVPQDIVHVEEHITVPNEEILAEYVEEPIIEIIEEPAIKVTEETMVRNVEEINVTKDFTQEIHEQIYNEEFVEIDLPIRNINEAKEYTETTINVLPAKVIIETTFDEPVQVIEEVKPQAIIEETKDEYTRYPEGYPKLSEPSGGDVSQLNYQSQVSEIVYIKEEKQQQNIIFESSNPNLLVIHHEQPQKSAETIQQEEQWLTGYPQSVEEQVKSQQDELIHSEMAFKSQTYPSTSAKTEEYTKTSKSKKGFSLPWKKKKQLEGYPLYTEVFDKDVSELKRQPEAPEKNLFDTISFQSDSEDSGLGADSGINFKKKGLICIPKSKKSKKTKTSEIKKINYTEVQANRNKKVKRARLFSFSKDYPEIGGEIYEGELKELKPIQEAKFTNLFDEINFALDEQSLEIVKQENDTKSKSTGLWCVPTAKKRASAEITIEESIKNENAHKIIEKAETYSMSEYYPEIGQRYEGELSEIAPAKCVQHQNIFDAINFRPKEEKIEILEIEHQQPHTFVKEKSKSSGLWCGFGSNKRKTSNVSSKSDESIKKGTLQALQVARNRIVQKARTFSMSENYPNQGEIFEGELFELSPAVQAPSANLFDSISFDDDPQAVIFTLESMATLNKETLPRERPNYLLRCLTCGTKKFNHYPAITEPYRGEILPLEKSGEMQKNEMSEFVSPPIKIIEKQEEKQKPVLYEKIEIQQSAYSEYPEITEPFAGQLNTIYPQQNIDSTNMNEYVTFENGSKQLDDRLEPVERVVTTETTRTVQEASPVKSELDNFVYKSSIEEQTHTSSASETHVEPFFGLPEVIVTEVSDLTPQSEIPKSEITEHICFSETGEGSHRRTSQVIAAQKHIIISDEAPEMISAITIMDEPNIVGEISPAPEMPSKNLFDTISFESDSDDSGLGADSGSKSKSGGLICIPKSKKSKKTKTSEIKKINYTEVQANRNKKIKRARLFSFSKDYPKIGGEIYEGELKELKPIQEAKFTNLFDEINFALDEQSLEIVKQENDTKSKSTGLWCVPTAKKRASAEITIEESIKNENAHKIIEKAETYSMSEYYPEIGQRYEGELSEIAPAKCVQHQNIFDAINFRPKEEKIEILEIEHQQPHTFVKEKSKSSGLWCGFGSNKRKTSNVSSKSDESIKKGTLQALQVARNRIVQKARTFSMSENYPNQGEIFEGELFELSPAVQAPSANLFDSISFDDDPQAVIFTLESMATLNKETLPRERPNYLLRCLTCGTKKFNHYPAITEPYRGEILPLEKSGEMQKNEMSEFVSPPIKIIEKQEEKQKPVLYEKIEIQQSAYSEYPEITEPFAGQLNTIYPQQNIDSTNMNEYVTFENGSKQLDDRLEPVERVVTTETTRTVQEASPVKSELDNFVYKSSIEEQTHTSSASETHVEPFFGLPEVIVTEVSDLTPQSEIPKSEITEHICFSETGEGSHRRTSQVIAAQKHIIISDEAPEMISAITIMDEPNIVGEISPAPEMPSKNLFDTISFESDSDDSGLGADSGSKSKSGGLICIPKSKKSKKTKTSEIKKINYTEVQANRNKKIKRARLFSFSKDYPEIGGEIYEGELKELKPIQEAKFTNLFDEINFAPDEQSLEIVKQENVTKSKSTGLWCVPTAKKQKRTASIASIKLEEIVDSKTIEKTETYSLSKYYPEVGVSYKGELSEIAPAKDSVQINIFDAINFRPKDDKIEIVETEKQPIVKEKSKSSGLWCGQTSKKQKRTTSVTSEESIKKGTLNALQIARNKAVARARTFSFSKDYPEIGGEIYGGELKELAPVKQPQFTNLFDEINFERDEDETVYKKRQPTKPTRLHGPGISFLWCAPKHHDYLSYPIDNKPYTGELKELKVVEEAPSANLFDCISFASTDDVNQDHLLNGHVVSQPTLFEHQQPIIIEQESVTVPYGYPLPTEIYDGEIDTLIPQRDYDHINIYERIEQVPKGISYVPPARKPSFLDKIRRASFKETSNENISLEREVIREEVQHVQRSEQMAIPTIIEPEPLEVFEKTQETSTIEMPVKEEIYIVEESTETTDVEQTMEIDLIKSGDVSYHNEVTIIPDVFVSEVVESDNIPETIEELKHYPTISEPFTGELSTLNKIEETPTSHLFDEINFLIIDKQPEQPQTAVPKISKQNKFLWCGGQRSESPELVKMSKTKTFRNRVRTFSMSKHYPEIAQPYEGELIGLKPSTEAPSRNLFDEISFASAESKATANEREKQKASKQSFWCIPIVKKQKRTTSITSIKVEEESVKNTFIEKSETYSMSKYYPEVGQIYEGELSEIALAIDSAQINIFDAINFRPKDDKIEIVETEKQPIVKEKSKSSGLWCGQTSKKQKRTTSVTSEESIKKGTLNALQIARNKAVARARTFSFSKDYPEIGGEIYGGELKELAPVKQPQFTNLFDEINFAPDEQSLEIVKQENVTKSKSTGLWCVPTAKKQKRTTSITSIKVEEESVKSTLIEKAETFSMSEYYPEIGQRYEGELSEIAPAKCVQHQNIFDAINFRPKEAKIEIFEQQKQLKPKKDSNLICMKKSKRKTSESSSVSSLSLQDHKNLNAMQIARNKIVRRTRYFSTSKHYPEIGVPTQEGELIELKPVKQPQFTNLFDEIDFATDDDEIKEAKKVTTEKQPSKSFAACLTCTGRKTPKEEEPYDIESIEAVKSLDAPSSTDFENASTLVVIEKDLALQKSPESYVDFGYPLITEPYTREISTLDLNREIEYSNLPIFERKEVMVVEDIPQEPSDELQTTENIISEESKWISGMPEIIQTERHHEIITTHHVTSESTTITEQFEHHEMPAKSFTSFEQVLSDYPQLTAAYESEVNTLTKVNEVSSTEFEAYEEPTVESTEFTKKQKEHFIEETEYETPTVYIEQTPVIFSNEFEKETVPIKTISKRTKMLAEKKHYPLIGTSSEGHVSELQRKEDFKESNLFDTISFISNSDDSGLGADSGSKSKSGGLICIPKSKKSKKTKTSEIKKINYTEVQANRNKKIKRARLFSFSKDYPEIGGEIYEGELKELKPIQEAKFTNLFDEINFAPDEQSLEIVKQENVTKSKSTGLWCVPTAKKQKRTASIASIKLEEIVDSKTIEKTETYSLSKYYPEVGVSYKGELSEIAPAKDSVQINIFDAINFRPKDDKIEIVETEKQPIVKEKSKSSGLWCGQTSKKKKRTTSVTSEESIKKGTLNALQIARNKAVARARTFSFSKDYPEIGGEIYGGELKELAPVKQPQFTNLFDEIDFAPDEQSVKIKVVEQQKQLKPKKDSNLICMKKSKRKTSESSSVSSLSLQDHKNLNAMQIARNKIVRRTRYFSTSKHYPEIGGEIYEGDLNELKPIQEAKFTNLFDEINFALDEENVIVKTTEIKQSVVPSSNKVGLCAPFKTSKRYPESEEPYTGIIHNTSLKQEVESADLFKCINFASSNEQQKEEEDKVGRMQNEERQPRKQMATLYFRRNTKQLEGYPLISEAYAGEVIDLLRRPELETTNLFDCVSFASESDDEIPISQSSNAKDSSKKGSPDKPKKKQLRLFGKTRRSTSDKELDLTFYPKTEAYSGPLNEITKANEMNQENLRKYITIYHSGYSQPFSRHRFIREKHEGVEEIGEAPADYEIAHFTADETIPMAPMSELEGLPLRSYAKYPIVSISESPRDVKRKFSKSKIIPESSSDSSSQSESETDTVPSLKPSKKKENEGFLSFFRNRLSAKQQQRKRTGYEGLMDKFAGTYDVTPKGNEMSDQPILEHVLVYHNGNSTQQPIDSGFEDGANASETERAGTFKRTGKLFFDKFKLSRDSGDKTTTEEIDKSESLEPKRMILTGYENLNTEPFLGLHSSTVYKNEIGQQPLTSTIDSIPTVYFYEGDATLSPVSTETTVETKVSTLERIIKSKRPRKDSNFAYQFLSVEGPTVDTDKKDEINDLPIGEHVTVYHCGRSDVPTAEVPPEVYVYEKEPISESQQSLTAAQVAEPQGSQIEHVTLVKKTTKRESLKPYPEPFTYEGPIESLERLSEAGNENLNEYVNIYHSGLSTDISATTKKLVKQESKTEKQPRRSLLGQYSFDTTPYEGAIEETSVKKELEHLPLLEHASMYHARIPEVQNLEDLEDREKQVRELSLVQRIMAMFKKRELQGYPSMGEEYIGPMGETNRAEDVEKSEIKNVTNIYHSGYSYDPKTSKLTLKRFAPKRRFRLNMNDYPKDSAPIDAVIYDLHATEDIPKTPSPVTLPPESLIFDGPPKERQQFKWYRFWFLRRRGGEPQNGSTGLEPSMPIIVESMSHRITDTSASIIMGTTDRSLFTKGHWPVTDIDVDVMLKTITKCHCECEALIIEKSFETGIGGSIQLQQHYHHQKQTLNDTSFRMDNNCIMQTSNGTWLAKVTKKISTQMEQKTDNIEVSKKAELYEKEEKNELNDEVLQPSTSVVKEKEVEDEDEVEDEIEVSRNSNLYYSKWDCEPPYLWSSDTYNNLEELIDDDELNIISKESGELPLTHEKKELEFINSSVRDSEMFASIRRRLSEKLAKKEKKKDEKRLKKEEKERKKHASKSGGGASGTAAGVHGSSTGGYASESSSSSASISDAEIEERHVVISKAIDGPVQTLKRGQELGDLDNIEEDIDNNNKKLVKMAPQTSMGASAVNNIEANSSGPYTPAKEKDGRVIREETVEQVYRISGTGHAPNLDPNDMSLQSTVDKCIRDTERMPRVQMVEANVLVKECEPLPHGISEGSAPHTTLHSWHETEDGPETITTEVDEHGNKITRTIKTQTTKHTIQKQTYQTYAVEDKDKPEQTIIQTKESTIPLGNKSVTRSPVVHTKSRTVAYEKGSEPHENIDPIGELVSTKTITTGNRTVEILTYKTEKDGVIETRVEHRVTIHSGDNIDHDAELAKALLEATEMSPDLIINRVEVEKQTQR